MCVKWNELRAGTKRVAVDTLSVAEFCWPVSQLLSSCCRAVAELLRCSLASALRHFRLQKREAAAVELSNTSVFWPKGRRVFSQFLFFLLWIVPLPPPSADTHLLRLDFFRKSFGFLLFFRIRLSLRWRGEKNGFHQHKETLAGFSLGFSQLINRQTDDFFFFSLQLWQTHDSFEKHSHTGAQWLDTFFWPVDSAVNTWSSLRLAAVPHTFSLLSVCVCVWQALKMWLFGNWG